VDVVAGFVSLEAGGEFVGVVEDFLGGAGHGGHLRYLGRAGMAWMMIGPSLVSTKIGWLKAVDHVVVGNAVLACAGRNE
jgi:hypothetical protein